MDTSRNEDEVGGCCPFFKRRGKKARPSASSGIGTSSGAVALKVDSVDGEGIPDKSGIVSGSIVDPKTLETPTTTEKTELPVISNDQIDISPETHSQSQHRARADNNFKAAAQKLQKVMSMAGADIDIPDTVTLKNVEQIKDVERTGRDLESAIEDLIDSRKEMKATRGRRQIVVDCVKGWFNVSFPYVKQTFTVAGVVVPKITLMCRTLFRVRMRCL